MTDLPRSEPSYFKRSLLFLSDYFLNSDNKWQAWLLLSGCILSVVAMISLGFILGWSCFPYIYAAFIAKDVAILSIGVGYSLLVAAAMAGVNYLTFYLKNELYVGWRTWLTKKMSSQYLKNHLDISRIYTDIDNPDQRIQEDIDKVIKSFLELILGFIDNCSNLVIYTVLLCLAGSSISFVLFGINIIIPGFFVWVALGVGIVTSLIGYFINNTLSHATAEETIIQSNLRADLQQVKTNSEEIAIEHAEPYYQDRFEKKTDELGIKTTQRLSIQNGTATFNLFNGIFQSIVPLIACAPLYFNDLLTLDAFYSVSYYFSMITRSLSWFIDSFETINKFQTSLARVLALQQVLDKNEESESTRNIIRTVEPHSKNLEVKNLDIKLHKSEELVFKGLDLKFVQGVHTLIQGASGSGKSSLFKVLAGTWLSGEGEIIIPGSLNSMYFLPQTPTIPNDTLRNVLAYPDTECHYSDNELIAALHAVKLKEFVGKLGEPVGFKSLGQQQRIAFARVFLRKPARVFLDESTASLDESVEGDIYKSLVAKLPNTSIVSIAHRSTVKPYHDKILFFKVNKKKEVQVEEENRVYELAL